MKNDLVALDQLVATDQLPDHRAIGVGREIGCEPAGSDRVTQRVVGERIDRIRRPRPAGVDGDLVERLDQGALVIGECGRVEAELGGGTDGLTEPLFGGGQFLRRRDPATDHRFDHLAGQEFELVDVDPASLRDDPVDGTVGCRLGRLRTRVDVEHLATADRLVAARLAQHVAVARQQRQLGLHEQPHRA